MRSGRPSETTAHKSFSLQPLVTSHVNGFFLPAQSIRWGTDGYGSCVFDVKIMETHVCLSAAVSQPLSLRVNFYLPEARASARTFLGSGPTEILAGGGRCGREFITLLRGGAAQDWL
jgi:hypothetical protein